jgi:hypothetical protein
VSAVRKSGQVVWRVASWTLLTLCLIAGVVDVGIVVISYLDPAAIPDEADRLMIGSATVLAPIVIVLAAAFGRRLRRELPRPAHRTLTVSVGPAGAQGGESPDRGNSARRLTRSQIRWRIGLALVVWLAPFGYGIANSANGEPRHFNGQYFSLADNGVLTPLTRTQYEHLGALDVRSAAGAAVGILFVPALIAWAAGRPPASRRR